MSNKYPIGVIEQLQLLSDNGSLSYDYCLGYKEGMNRILNEQKAPLQGAVWIKASDRLPEKDGYYCFKANGGYMGAYLRTESNGNRWWCDSAGGTIRNWKNCEWLDESPSKESDAVDPIKFHKWLIDQHWEEHSSGRYWHRSKDRHQWPPEQTAEETELPKLYQQSNK